MNDLVSCLIPKYDLQCRMKYPNLFYNKGMIKTRVETVLLRVKLLNKLPSLSKAKKVIIMRC